MSEYLFFSAEYLRHSGVAHDENPPGPGSGRYKWGSGENPRQNTADAMRKSKLKEMVEKHRRKKVASAIASGKKKKIEKQMKHMTDEEMELAIQRLGRKKRIDAIEPDKPLMDSIDEIVNNVARVSNWIGTASTAINNTANLVTNIGKLNKEAQPMIDRIKDPEGAKKKEERAKALEKLAKSDDFDRLSTMSSMFSTAQLQDIAKRRKAIDEMLGKNKDEPKKKKDEDDG